MASGYYLLATFLLGLAVKLEFTPYVLPYIVSTLILVYLSLYARRLRKQVETAGLFSILSLTLSVWTVCYALELVSPSLESKIFWAKMKYLGAAPGPVMWFVFSLHYTNYRHWLTRPLKLALALFVFLTLGIVFTNELHHWYWTRIYTVADFPETLSEHGFYFWVYAAGNYLLVLASVLFYVNYYRRVPAIFRQQAILMVLGGFLPLGTRILEDFIGWDPFPKIDNVILFLLLSAILFSISLFRLGALDLVPIAHNLVVRNIRSGILVLDALGRIVEINPFAQKLIELEGQTVIGKTLASVFKDWTVLGYAAQISEQMEHEISLLRGEMSLYFLVQISPIRSESDQLIGHVIVLVDITDRKRAEIELAHLARTDVLTSVTNRRHFFELAELQFAHAQRYQHSLSILMLDVDHFKQVNDRYGHVAGDLVLQMVASVCSDNLRTTDLFARYGGEEFICLLPEQDPEGALETAERIRRKIEQTNTTFGGQSILVTVSIGLALAQNDTDLKLEQLIDRADEALYQAKANGRNRVTLWQSTYN